ncbi:MAG: DNA internalization-related competence protein ComEC/Rec2 [Pseudomonadota bacterium]
MALLCPTYPDKIMLLVLFLFTGLICFTLKLWLALIAACGFFGFALSISHQLTDRWPLENWNHDAELVVRISSFSRESAGRIQFVVEPVESARWPKRVRVAWYRSEARPKLGEIWRLNLRLRAPRGLANPYSFDFERWQFANGIGASAYVRESDGNARLASTPSVSVSDMRRQIVASIAGQLPDDAASAVLVALSVGSRHKMSAGTREHMARTGTLHLMAISGLHIGLAAAIGLLAGRLVRLLLNLIRCGTGSVHLPACIGFASALFYAALAGFSIPTQRALIMLGLVLPLVSSGRMASPVKILGLAALLVVVVQPASLLGVSFHLSFSVVLVLIGIASRDRMQLRSMDRPGLKTLRWQWWLCCLSVPLNMFFFGRVSLVAPLANVLAVPFYSFAVVPCLFYGLSGLPGSVAALTVAHKLTSLSLDVLEGLSSLSAASVYSPELSGPDVLLLLLALVVFALPGSVLRRLPLIGLSLLLALIPKQQIEPGCYQLQVFDVGQGQAILIRTARNALLFDTGPGFSGGGSSASNQILPALRALNIGELERVIVSHADFDHRGGLGDILQAMPGTPVNYSGDANLFPPRAIACKAGMRWELDRVPFEFLHPAGASTGNNGSCVLKIGTTNTATLLTGDIERKAERQLVERESHRLKSLIVSVPHHGSETSSAPEFVQAVAARYALVSAGYRNRWSFPREPVVARWQASGSRVFNVADQGALSIKVCPSVEPDIAAFRASSPRFWRYRAP